MTHMNYTKFPDGEAPVTRTFRLARVDWTKLQKVRDDLLAMHGVKLSLNATLVHLLHCYGDTETETKKVSRR